MSVTREGEPQASGAILKGPLEMSEVQFRQWSRLLEDRTGMQLSPERKSFLQTGVAMRMRELACTDYQAYFNLISDLRRGALEWSTLVDRLTNHETRFFRNPEAFDVVRGYLAEQAGSVNRSEPCDVWSVGCSTGEETYSLAMVVQDVLGDGSAEHRFSVTGTDISLPVLTRARQGRYSRCRLQPVSNQYRQRFLREAHGVEDEFEIVPDLKRRVCFSQVNVLELDRVPMSGLQIVYCMNLLIYFRRELRLTILGQLAARLRPGGLLVIGAGDAPKWKPRGFDLLPDRSVQAYRKAPGPAEEVASGTH